MIIRTCCIKPSTGNLVLFLQIIAEVLWAQMEIIFQTTEDQEKLKPQGIVCSGIVSQNIHKTEV